MPQPKWYHKSLAELCMNSIVDNMEKWTESRSSVHVSSLFYLLPSHCLEYMTEYYAITEDMFDLLLLSPHMKVLDLSQDYWGTGHDLQRNFRIFRLASVNCLQLTTLKINDGGFSFPFSDPNRNFEVEETFASILQLFEHLQILDLSGTIYGARSMLKLGSTNKPKIRELLVNGCPGVTDTVVEVFCKGQSSFYKLSLIQTKVSHIGLRFAIEHLAELKKLNCDNQSDVYKAFRRIRKESRESKKYSLIKLFMENMVWTPLHKVPYKKGSVSLMVDMCPSIVDVLLSVNDEGFTNEELLGFRELKLLKNLKIGMDRFTMSPFSIRGGVIPLLQARGPTLEELSLWMEVTSEEVNLIIECCPNVRRLRLVIKSTDLGTPELAVDDRVHSSLCSRKEVFPLRMLDVISLKSNQFSPSRFYAISRKLLLLLLSSPTLTKISIDECFTLDDQIIEEACTENSFKNLTKLKFHGCSNVSQKGIDFFLNEANPLSEIIVTNCGNVNLEHMKTMAQEKHWDQVKIIVR
ncbi:uncharacterized protein LOC124313003 isoform X2 [Daphnia pulicaria]|uniref:uncharacterized protein LOC124313003 isoform X2 n=1 Tax=Daphnia pulicaria TaxID=35523 RepID=UPI001EEB4FDA|nr:uncharacterized protein LOC124313003 isoform X2 [Daphnia pulicaria]